MSKETYEKVLETLKEFQDEQMFSEVNELILRCEEQGGDYKRAADTFELQYASKNYGQWLNNNSCGYDQVIY